MEVDSTVTCYSTLHIVMVVAASLGLLATTAAAVALARHVHSLIVYRSTSMHDRYVALPFLCIPR